MFFSKLICIFLMLKCQIIRNMDHYGPFSLNRSIQLLLIYHSHLYVYPYRYTVPGIYNPQVCASNAINGSCTNFPQLLTVENRLMTLYIDHDSLLQLPGPSANLDFEIFTAPGEFPTNISCLWQLADGRNFRFVLPNNNGCGALMTSL